MADHDKMGKEEKSMKVMELLAKVQMDDHKDAQMLTDWAEDARELGHQRLKVVCRNCLLTL